MSNRSKNLNARKLLAAAVLSTVFPFATNRHGYGVMFKGESDGGAGDGGGDGGGGAGDGGADKGGKGKKGGGGDNSGGGSGDGGNPDLEEIRRDRNAARKARDKAKQGLRQLAAAVGIDPEAVEIEETGDAENPYRLKVEGLDEIATVVQNHRKGKKGGGTADADAVEELNRKHQTAVQKIKKAHKAEVAARDAWIQSTAVVEPLRAALAAEGAIDDSGDGSFNDLVALLSPRVRAKAKFVDADEDNPDAKPTFDVVREILGPDGTPMLDKAEGKPVSLRAMVKDFLDKKPHFRSPKFRPGPGAGGNGGGTGAAGGPVDRKQHARKAAAALFGRRVETAQT